MDRSGKDSAAFRIPDETAVGDYVETGERGYGRENDQLLAEQNAIDVLSLAKGKAKTLVRHHKTPT